MNRRQLTDSEATKLAIDHEVRAVRKIGNIAMIVGALMGDTGLMAFGTGCVLDWLLMGWAEKRKTKTNEQQAAD